jgi:ParB-like chromosome segregation protein Spo0J
VCGQGRLEAFLALGESEIPAVVIDASHEDCFVMSLVENLARRQHSPLELMRRIGDLRKRGYTIAQIASKTDFSEEYIYAICYLLEHGEQRLLAAVERGVIPPTVAMEIARAKDGEVQQALAEAYERKSIPGRQVLAIRRIIEQRASSGKHMRGGNGTQSQRGTRRVTADALVRRRKGTERQRILVKKATIAQGRLLFVVNALRRLFADEHFVRPFCELRARHPSDADCRASQRLRPPLSSNVRIAFEERIETLPLSQLLPLNAVSPELKQSAKYKQIAKSVAEVGVIEPLVVARSPEQPRHYLLLDGHIRHAVLADAGETEVRCLIALDDEAFTYNKRINRLATIQEHFMIVRAIERGVSEDKLAKALDLDVKAIRRRRMMLGGICPEVVDLLKDKSLNPTTFDVLRKMKPMRQIEAADLMSTAGNYTASYAKALLAATRQADLVKSEQPKKVGGLTPDQMARMEREMETVQQDLKMVEARYGDDVLHLVIASGYLSKLLNNKDIRRYLSQHHPELLAEFIAIVSATSLDQSGSTA